MRTPTPRPLGVHAGRMPAEGEERRGWWVVLRGGLVEEVRPSRPAGVEEVDLGDGDLLPGLVDLHSDCMETKARPRPGLLVPMRDAILDLDAEVAAHGITTHHLCVSLDEAPGKLRTLARAVEATSTLQEIRDQLRVEHRVHLRVELTGPGMDLAAELAAAPVVAMLSYMVHLPGIGQFKDERMWKAFYDSRGGTSDWDAQEVVARRSRFLHDVDARRRRLAGVAHQAGVVLAAHDDDSLESVRLARELGAAISEFPVNAEAARAAAEAGLGVVMGAPNARRGSSVHGNLSAREVLAAGGLTALASDYHPPSLLAAAYRLAEDGDCSWTQAVALVTAGPARLAGLADRGEIVPGRRADLVAVTQRAGLPAVDQVWREGRPVLGMPAAARGTPTPA